MLNNIQSETLNDIMKDYSIIVIGPGGSGKDTLANYLTSELSNLKKIVRYTSRLPRVNEIDGIDYHFIDYTDYKYNLNKKNFIFFSEYKMIANGEYKTVGYGTKIDDFNPGTISVVSMKEFESMFVNNLDVYLRAKNVMAIKLYVDEKSRLDKMIRRGDEKEEAERRVKDDEKWYNIIDEIFEECNYFKQRNKLIEINNSNYAYSPDKILELIYFKLTLRKGIERGLQHEFRIH